LRFVLGGLDTEMREIEAILIDAGYSVLYAKIGENRVNRSEAYEATYPTPIPTDVWVECRPADYSQSELYSLGIDLVDHHQEGDVGYDMPPSQYWEASSLGQICNRLGVERTQRLNYIAAADHCLLPAYHEQCPEVDRAGLLAFRMKFFEQFHPNPLEYLKKLHKKVLNGPSISMLGTKVYDVSGVFGKDRKWLSDLACCYGMKTFSINQKPNRYKMFVSNLSVKEIEKFCNEYAPSLGTVINVYGDPKRQFAGAVVEGSYVRKD
jgi:hypothetical protein